MIFAGIGDHFEVKISLKNLDSDKLRDLGGALGLFYPNLRRMTNILDDMTAAWLNKEDDILDKSGEPTWSRLVEALEKIGQKGVAEDIINERDCRDNVNESSSRGIKYHCIILPFTRSLYHCIYPNIHPNIHTCMKDWWWYIVRGLFLLLIISLLYIYWPVNIYALNLYLSKTLPYISENFVGREQDMKEIKRLIDFKSNDIRIVNIIGPPGFGKSTLAIHAAHDMVRNGVIVHYINMAEVTDKAVIKEIAEKILGNSDTKIDNPVTFEPLLRWIQHRFWNTLLILDNCDDALNNHREELQDAIMKMVEESLGVKILMTSRRIATFINYYEWYRVEELSTEAACKLLENKVPKEIHLSHEMKKNITRSTGKYHWPFTLLVLCFNCQLHPHQKLLSHSLKRSRY